MRGKMRCYSPPSDVLLLFSDEFNGMLYQNWFRPLNKNYLVCAYKYLIVIILYLFFFRNYLKDVKIKHESKDFKAYDVQEASSEILSVRWIINNKKSRTTTPSLLREIRSLIHLFSNLIVCIFLIRALSSLLDQEKGMNDIFAVHKAKSWKEQSRQCNLKRINRMNQFTFVHL